MMQIDRRILLTRVTRIGALTLCAGTIAACGNGGTDNAAAPTSRDADGPLKFAKCMREHGVDMPDPKVNGNGAMAITLRADGKGGNTPAKLDKAQEACRKYMGKPTGPPPDAAAQAKMRDAFLAYARCMREHDIDMPDPQFSSTGGGATARMTRKAGSSDRSGPDPTSAAFKAADGACHKLLGEGNADMPSAAPAAPISSSRP